MNELIIENEPKTVGSVAAWQNILNGCGFNPVLIITGYMDDATVAATKAFQKDVGFSETGSVDQATWAAGLSYTKSPDWSNVTPQVSVRRNIDPSADAQWSMTLGSIRRWSRKELTQQLIAKAKSLGLPLKTHWAYMMATIEWETASTFEPVREAYWLSEDWRQKNLSYYPFYGRGYVQLTWKSNYQEYSSITGLNLVGEPDLAMKPDVALYIIVHGFKHGAFTDYKLDDFVNPSNTDYYHARKCINWLDKASEIKELAESWEGKL